MASVLQNIVIIQQNIVIANGLREDTNRLIADINTAIEESMQLIFAVFILLFMITSHFHQI